MRCLAVLSAGLLLAISVLMTAGIGGEGGLPSSTEIKSYVPHPPIEIEGNGDFIPKNGVLSGSGTASDPYIIEGWDIDADGPDFGIYIGNTTKCFIIRDCMVHGANDGNGNINIVSRRSDGITFNNVENGAIEDCTFFDNHCADIHLYHSDNNRITGNSCGSIYGTAAIILEWSSSNELMYNDLDTHYRFYDPTNGTVTKEHGLLMLYDSCDNTFSENQVRNYTLTGILVTNNGCDRAKIGRNIIQFNGAGIDISGEGQQVMDNIIINNLGTGIYADMVYMGAIGRNLVKTNGNSGILIVYDGGMGNEGINVISNNIVKDNGLDGIGAHGKDSVYCNNTVTDNGQDGISIRMVRNNIIDNHIADNKGIGIFIEARWKDPAKAFGNLILSNNIIDNSVQGLDQCQNNNWNGSVQGNYWSDMTGPDNNTDGIVDTPYYVNMTSVAADWYPATAPFKITTIGPVIPPRILTEDVNSISVNETYDVTYEAYDPYIVSGPLDWDIRTNASWLDISGTRISGTPQEEDAGKYWVNVTVYDGSESDNRRFMISVLPLPDDGDDPGNDTTPGGDDNQTDPGNDTTPGDDDQTDPGEDDNQTDPGNDTTPGDDDGNQTVPDDDDDQTDPGNDTVPGDDDDDGGNGVWTKENNKAPSQAGIEAPEGKIRAGRTFRLSASAFDPDLESGDSLKFDWYIDGIGYVGSGETLDLVLEEGSYTVRLHVTDHYGLRTEISGQIEVLGEPAGALERLPLFAAAIVAVVLGLALASIFVLRRNKPEREVVHQVYDDDGPECAPINIRTHGGQFSGVRSGPLDMGPGNDLRPSQAPVGVAPMAELSFPEEKELKEIRMEAIISKRSPVSYRRKELRDLLRRKQGGMDSKAYLAVSSILEE